MVLSDADWQEAFDINLFAAVRLDRGFLPSMLQQGSGVIIHISSIQRALPLFDSTQMLDGFNQGWIEFEGGENSIAKRQNHVGYSFTFAD